MAFIEITKWSTSLFIGHYLHTLSRPPERRYVQSRLLHDTVTSSNVLFDALLTDKCDIFSVLNQGLLLYHICIMEGQAAPHHCLFDGFLKRWCSVVLFYERHDKLFRQLFDEQPPRVCHSVSRILGCSALNLANEFSVAIPSM